MPLITVTPHDLLKRELKHRLDRVKLYGDKPTDWDKWLEAVVIPDLEKLGEEYESLKQSTQYHLEQVRYELSRLEKLYS